MLRLDRLAALGRPFYYHAAIDTTMREAAELAARGEPSGAFVIAERQTAGRGRLGRTWVAEPGGLYFSVILRPAVSPADAAALTLALGLATGRAIHRVAGVPCDLRWPNDVMLHDRKCAGILAELDADGGRLRHIIAGIGVNVNQARLPGELAATATSLRIQTGCDYARETLLEEILAEIDRYTGILVERGPAAVVELFTRASSYAAGRRVVVIDGEAETAGVTAGLTSAGVLLLRRQDGSVAPVLAGSVRPLTDSPCSSPST